MPVKKKTVTALKRINKARRAARLVVKEKAVAAATAAQAVPTQEHPLDLKLPDSILAGARARRMVPPPLPPEDLAAITLTPDPAAEIAEHAGDRRYKRETSLVNLARRSLSMKAEHREPVLADPKSKTRKAVRYVVEFDDGMVLYAGGELAAVLFKFMQECEQLCVMEGLAYYHGPEMERLNRKQLLERMINDAG